MRSGPRPGCGGKNAVDLTAALAPGPRHPDRRDPAADEPADLSRLRVVADWVQYRNSFRAPVELRPVVGGAALELAVDLRRTTGPDADRVATAVAAELHAHRSGGSSRDHVTLEEWGPTRRSRIWEFNTLYWQHLRHWEEVTGRGYESALPGGQSDARDAAPVRETITELFTIWDALAERRALPEELYVVELGVGNGGQARTWLDTFVELDRAHGRDYHRRLHYLMCDYSPHVLELARAAVAEHASRVSSFVLDAIRPLTSLAFLRFKVFLVYISNVYDNLPTDEIATIGQREHLVRVPGLPAGRRGRRRSRAASRPDRRRWAGWWTSCCGWARSCWPRRRRSTSPAASAAAVEFWRDCWQALRLQERYVPLHGLDTYQIAPGHHIAR